MTRITPVVKNLIIINVILYFGLKYGLDAFKANYYMYLLPIGEGFNPYQLFTHMFMHGDERHLFFNMLTLFFLGPITEQTLGQKRFLTLFITAGIIGGITHILTSNAAAVGASGAINGVVVAFATMFPNMKLMVFPLPFEVKAKYLVGLFVFIDFYFGVTNYSSGIAHFAHLGGAITGFAMIHMWKLANLR